MLMLRTTLLLGALTGLILGIGQWLGGSQGLILAFVFAILMNFGSYWFSDKIVLAMYSARQVSEAKAPMLYRIVHNLALRAGMPMPRLYPIAAMIIQMAISRTREYAADATGACLSSDPLGLASALGKLGAASERIPLDASPQTSHLFIVNPLSGRSLMQLFSTHPHFSGKTEGNVER
jgi:Zn-dependent protease with chaperone function